MCAGARYTRSQRHQIHAVWPLRGLTMDWGNQQSKQTTTNNTAGCSRASQWPNPSISSLAPGLTSYETTSGNDWQKYWTETKAVSSPDTMVPLLNTQPVLPVDGGLCLRISQNKNTNRFLGADKLNQPIKCLLHKQRGLNSDPSTTLKRKSQGCKWLQS